LYIPIRHQYNGGEEISSVEKEWEGNKMTRLEMQEKAMDLFMKHLH
jgi:hypothetical protein